MKSIHIGGQRLPVNIRRHPTARQINLRLADDGVRVTLPRRLAVRHAEAFVREQVPWLVKQVARRQKSLADVAAELGLSPGQILLRGQPHAPLAEATLRRLARQDLAACIERHRHLVTNQPTRLTIRDQRSRWGSCSSNGTLSFSFRLVMTPPAVLEYLVIHELVHLDVPNHSSAFWQRVLAACPATREHERWLRRFGPLLMSV